MPTILRVGPYRFFFYSLDCDEPPHVHVQRDQEEAKLWLEPVEVERNHGFAGHELRKIRKLVVQNRSLLLSKWHEYCSR